MKKKAALAFALSIIIAGGIVGCGSIKENGAKTDTATDQSSRSVNAITNDAPTEELAEEQVLNLVYTDLTILDVNDARNANEFQVLSQVQEGLFRTFTGEDGVDRNENAGATGYDVSDDGLTYTFHLREDAKWSDGEPVTAQNYVDSWIRLADPEKAFSYAFLVTDDIVGAEEYYNGKGSAEDVGVKVIDDHTFEATLKAPNPSFIKKAGMLPLYPIRKDLVDAAEKDGKNWGNDYTLHVFNGPFVISDRVLENSMVLSKNENYWDAEHVYLTQVNLKVVDESSTQAQLVESQQVDILKLSDLEYVDQWQSLVDAGTLDRVISTAPAVTYISFDQHKDAKGGPSGLMDNAKVREAITLAFDREEYNLLFQNGLSTPAYGLVPNGITVGDKEYRSYAGNILGEDEKTALSSNPAALKALFEE